jgi:prevent-host-death family protein
MIQVSATELKNKIGPVIDRVIAGEATAVTRAGREVVALQEIGRYRAEQHELAMLRPDVDRLHAMVTRLLYAAGVAPHQDPRGVGVEHLAALVDMVVGKETAERQAVRAGEA